MTREEMIAAVEEEVQRLDQIRNLLAKSHSERFTLPESEIASPIAGEVKKRVLSPEARRSIAQAQQSRWAKKKGEAAAASDAK